MRRGSLAFFTTTSLVGAVLFGCSGSGSGSSGDGGTSVNTDAANTDAANTTPPVIRHLGFDVERYDSATGFAGGFDFENFLTVQKTSKPFVEFGGMFIWGEGPANRGTTYEWDLKLRPDAQIYSLFDGVVVRLDSDPQHGDFELGLRPASDSSWQLVLDHLSNLLVDVGDSVAAGEPLASPGNYVFEISLMQDAGPDADTLYCMLDYFDPALKEDAGQKLADLMGDWETYLITNSVPLDPVSGVTNPQDLYDEAAMTVPGCLLSSHKE